VDNSWKSELAMRKLKPTWGIAVDPSKRGPGGVTGAPNAGRPREQWKAWLRGLVDSPATREAVLRVLGDPDHPQFARVLAWADERAFGREQQVVAGDHQLTVVRRDETGAGAAASSLEGAPTPVVRAVLAATTPGSAERSTAAGGISLAEAAEYDGGEGDG
jgi:hypothetical protein